MYFVESSGNLYFIILEKNRTIARNIFVNLKIIKIIIKFIIANAEVYGNIKLLFLISA
jgi:hypothetical protein